MAAQAASPTLRRSGGADRSQLTAQQAEADKATMRTRLSEQLNKILQTRDSARGLSSVCPMCYSTRESTR